MIQLDQGIKDLFPRQLEKKERGSVVLSIVVLAYNHSETILECLTSIAMQQFSEDLEVIIGLNESTDLTDRIVEEFVANREEWDVVYLSRDNTTTSAGIFTGASNLYNCLRHVNGEYVSVIEGDDYFSSDLKLQTQFDILKVHEGWSGVMNPISVLCRNGEMVDFKSLRQYDRIKSCSSNQLCEEDFIEQGNCVHLLGFMFRSELLSLRKEYLYSAAQDHVLGVLLSKNLPIGFVEIPEMAVYRGYGGSFSELTQIRNQILSSLKWSAIACAVSIEYQYLVLGKLDAINSQILVSNERSIRKELSMSEILKMVIEKFKRRFLV